MEEDIRETRPNSAGTPPPTPCRHHRFAAGPSAAGARPRVPGGTACSVTVSGW